MIWDGIVLAIATFFAVASYRQGKRNSRRDRQAVPDKKVLYTYYFSTGLFATCVLTLGFYANGLTWIESTTALVIVVSVHLLRAYFECSLDPTYLIRSSIIRYIMDSIANLSAIVFALFVTSAGNRVLAVAAIFFGLMLILKELKFRVSDDVEFVESASLSSDQGGDRHLLQRRAKRRDFFANYLKSYFYITLGFAILYRCAAFFIPSAQSAIEQNGTNGMSPGWDALWFSVGGLVLGSSPGQELILQVMMGVQFLVSIMLATQILATVYRSTEP